MVGQLLSMFTLMPTEDVAALMTEHEVGGNLALRLSPPLSNGLL